MYIRYLEQIFSIDKVVPVDLFPVFWQIRTITMLFIQVRFLWKPYFPCRSLLLSTTILNDNAYWVYEPMYVGDVMYYRSY